MNTLALLFLGALSGLGGAYAMHGFMRSVSSAYSKRVDMIRALGSYFTGNLDTAHTLGTRIHIIAGIAFGILYLAIIQKMGALNLPFAIFLGLGFGFFHGLFISYLLMFYASEKHPIEQYRKATLEEGLLHLVGHVIYGGTTGLLGGLLATIFGT